MNYEKLRRMYREEGWGALAEEAGFDPVHTETAARAAFAFCHARIRELENEVARLSDGENHTPPVGDNKETTE